MLIDRPTVLVAATLAIVGLAWSRPRWAIALLLAALPFFTHHPSSFPTVMLILLVAAFEIAYLVRWRPSAAWVWEGVSRQPLLLLSALFAGAALLSLSSLPLAGIWREHAAMAATQPWTAWPGLALDWILLTEVRREFPITSAALVLEGVVLALIVWRETRASSAAAVLFTTAVTTGAVVFVALGLLEAFGATSLEAWRGSASVYVRQGTLQSASGNPGWFSQYMVYALPCGLALLAGKTARIQRLALLAGSTGLLVFALLVSWQRGGWIAGAAVVLYMGAAVALLPESTGGAGAQALRSRVGRTLAVGGLVLALVAGAFSVWTAKAQPGGTAFGADAYVSRFKSIGDADRLSYLRAGLMIAALHPVLGGGHESFAYRYGRYFDAPGGPYHRSPVRVPEAASAHSVFVQTLSGTGAVGLLLLAGISATAGWTVARAVRTPDADPGRHVVLLATGGSLLGMALYGLVQEIFYVHALRLFFFASVGLVAGVSGEVPRWPPRAGRMLASALAAAFLCHLVYEYAWPGPARLLEPGEVTGVHLEAREPGDARPQWSSDWSTWPVPPGATSFRIRVRSLAAFPQDVALTPCGGKTQRIVLADHDWHSIRETLEGCEPGDRLELRVSPAWRAPGDARLLGVLTDDVRFEGTGAR